jgi:predicted DCC family thiol-disulfide oxidoreductase YuxK
MMPKEHILFFDGLCGFCNKTIDYFILKDTKKRRFDMHLCRERLQVDY